MEKSCETCGFLRDGFLCGLDGVDIRVGHCEKYKAGKPKDVNQDVVQNELLKFSDICLGACSDKSCSTCKHVEDRFSDRCFSACFNHSLWEPKKSCSTCGHVRDVSSVLCHSECVNHSLWEPKGSDIRAAQESIDRAFTEFTDKLKGCDPETPLSDTQKKISEICDEIKNVLLEKNRKYGDSALNPKRVFSKASPIEQINVRIDDKISRIMSAQDDDTEDAELDLIGYLILKRVAKRVAHDVQ